MNSAVAANNSSNRSAMFGMVSLCFARAEYLIDLTMQLKVVSVAVDSAVASRYGR